MFKFFRRTFQRIQSGYLFFRSLNQHDDETLSAIQRYLLLAVRSRKRGRKPVALKRHIRITIENELGVTQAGDKVAGSQQRQ